MHSHSTAPTALLLLLLVASPTAAHPPDNRPPQNLLPPLEPLSNVTMEGVEVKVPQNSPNITSPEAEKPAPPAPPSPPPSANPKMNVTPVEGPEGGNRGEMPAPPLKTSPGETNIPVNVASGVDAGGEKGEAGGEKGEAGEEKPVQGEGQAGEGDKPAGEPEKKVTEPQIPPQQNTTGDVSGKVPPPPPKLPTSPPTPRPQEKAPPTTTTTTTTTPIPLREEDSGIKPPETEENVADEVEQEDDDEDDEDGRYLGYQEPDGNRESQPSLLPQGMGDGVIEGGQFRDDEGSHFFAYFLTVMVTAIIFYLVFHNKQRIMALIIEGRAPNSRRRRRASSRARYTRLDNTLEEAITATRSDKVDHRAL